MDMRWIKKIVTVCPYCKAENTLQYSGMHIECTNCGTWFEYDGKNIVSDRDYRCYSKKMWNRITRRTKWILELGSDVKRLEEYVVQDKGEF
ncbi:MAG: hypothetical protein QXT14_08930 [Candidatus Bathyarchaeia archaeon]